MRRGGQKVEKERYLKKKEEEEEGRMAEGWEQMSGVCLRCGGQRGGCVCVTQRCRRGCGRRNP